MRRTQSVLRTAAHAEPSHLRANAWAHAAQRREPSASPAGCATSTMQHSRPPVPSLSPVDVIPLSRRVYPLSVLVLSHITHAPCSRRPVQRSLALAQSSEPSHPHCSQTQTRVPSPHDQYINSKLSTVYPAVLLATHSYSTLTHLSWTIRLSTRSPHGARRPYHGITVGGDLLGHRRRPGLP